MLAHNSYINRKTHPILIEAYEQLCMNCNIHAPPILRFNSNTITGECKRFDVENIYLGERFFKLALDKQLDLLTHELYHIHEYELLHRPELKVSMIAPPKERESAADAFAAALNTPSSTAARIESNALERSGNLNAIRKDKTNHRRIQTALKAESDYLTAHDTVSVRIEGVKHLDIDPTKKWAEKLIEARNNAIAERQ